MIVRERVFAAVIMVAVVILAVIVLMQPDPALVTCGAENCAQLLGESAPLVGETP